MAKYRYMAQDKEGKVLQDVLEAPNMGQAIDLLARRNLKILQIKPISVEVKVPFLGKKKADPYAVLQMTKRLATMFKAGLGVNRMIQVLAEQETDLPLKQALEDVQERLKSGEPFSKAFGRHPEVFSVLYVSMLRVGETAGAMGQVLNHLSEFLEQDHKVVAKFKSAMTYPMFIFGTSVIVVGGLFTFVLPPLLQTCVEMAGGAQLPLPTIILMAVMAGIKNPLVQIGLVGGLIWAISAYRIAYQTPQGRYNIDRTFLIIPLVGDLNRKLLVSRFCRSWGIMARAGIGVKKALDVLADFIDNSFFRREVVDVIAEDLKAGIAISASMKNIRFLPTLVTSIVGVGEAVGDLPAMLVRLADYYDREIIYAVEAVLTMIEPIMIAVMGSVVCFVILSVFLPLYQVVMNMGH